MPRSGDRRPLLADNAIELLASGGARALTHHGVDRRAELPLGSTSYYFRTREALVAATIERIQQHSRASFESAVTVEIPTAESATVLIGDQLRLLVGARRAQVLAVFALLPEVEKNRSLRRALSNCLFSRDRAKELFRQVGSSDPQTDADDLVVYLTGLLFDLIFGSLREAAEESRDKTVLDSIERFLFARSATENRR